MLTTTRVSFGIAFGPDNISGLAAGVGLAFAVSVGAAGEGGEGAGVALTRGVFWLFGSTVQPVETRNTDKIKINRDSLILLTPFHLRGATGVPRFYM